MTIPPAFELAAFERIRKELVDVINATPLQHSRTFSETAGCTVLLKPECLQKNGSFKIRGAYAVLATLSTSQRAKGVVTCSAGNWAQGVAYAGSLLHTAVTVVMPTRVARSKLEATRGYGADIVLHGTTSTELFQKARELSETRNRTYLHAFDEPAMIIGHGSIGLELLEEVPDLDVMVVPVGGGALISGIALAAKQIRPDIRVYGAQPEGAAAMYHSLREGAVTELASVNTVAEGLAVKRPGERTFQLVRKFVDGIVLVRDEHIVKAVVTLLERAKLLVEPSGAVSLAAVFNKQINDIGPDSKVAVVLSGGNIDLSVLRSHLPTG